jgi:hypothetical protein
MADDVGTAALRARAEGRARTGIVTIRDFDQGVVETLGAKVIDGRYFITELSDVDPAPGQPGIPVVFSHPEDVLQTHRIPVIEVRRDDITAALNRWHPGMTTYRAPTLGAHSAVSPYDASQGWDSYEEAQQAAPYDILYTLNIQARQRTHMAAANKILAYVMKIYQPYSGVNVYDSVGDLRSYEAFLEGIAPLDSVPEVTERMIGFALSLRVEAELDINDPTIHRAVTKTLRINQVPITNLKLR